MNGGCSVVCSARRRVVALAPATAQLREQLRLREQKVRVRGRSVHACCTCVVIACLHESFARSFTHRLRFPSVVACSQGLVPPRFMMAKCLEDLDKFTTQRESDRRSNMRPR